MHIHPFPPNNQSTCFDIGSSAFKGKIWWRMNNNKLARDQILFTRDRILMTREQKEAGEWSKFDDARATRSWHVIKIWWRTSVFTSRVIKIWWHASLFISHVIEFWWCVIEFWWLESLFTSHVIKFWWRESVFISRVIEFWWRERLFTSHVIEFGWYARFLASRVIEFWWCVSKPSGRNKKGSPRMSSLCLYLI